MPTLSGEKFRTAMKDAHRLPVVSLSAEYLAIGHLMRRNVLAYKAPPNAEGYDLVCIQPRRWPLLRVHLPRVPRREGVARNNAWSTCLDQRHAHTIQQTLAHAARETAGRSCR